MHVRVPSHAYLGIEVILATSVSGVTPSHRVHHVGKWTAVGRVLQQQRSLVLLVLVRCCCYCCCCLSLLVEVVALRCCGLFVNAT